MATEAEAKPAAAGAAEPAGAPAGGKSKKLLIGGIVAAVTLLECGAGYMMLPRGQAADIEAEMAAEEEAAHASDEKHDAHGGGHGGGHGKEKKEKGDAHGKGAAKPKAAKPKAGEQSEVDLGEFHLTAFQPLSNTTVRLDFHLFGTVAAGHEEEFTALLEAKKQRFRDQVIATVRSVEMADFTEAGLGLIKRRILETTNRAVGQPCLQSVLFSEFSFIEQ